MKKGSALLVVLGMLSFMLISAVAFSAYMRYARLPSSFLRRSSASRMLAKAALAEAIDEIDAAIGNNPHPGVGTRSPRLGAGSLAADLNGIQNEDARTRNHWKHRVYIGTNELHHADDTVSTLTLEGLAYIPPALVNEARYYSRRSQAGIWRPLGFDSGRYAFCAIDVSDMFDVNVLAAKVARSSSAAGKISLAYLFENPQHTGYDADPKEWDNFVEVGAKARKISAAEAEAKGETKAEDPNYVPFVSVADLNLAIEAQNPAGWESPFCKYVQNSGADFYNGVGATDPNGPNADKVRNMSFVTDGWFPEHRLYSTSAGGKINPDIDICDPNNQPFPQPMLAECDSIILRRLLEYGTSEASSPGAFRLRNHIGGLGLALLYDYLDENNVPVSLAVPEVERTPMIVGIKPDFSALNVAIAEPETDPKGIDANTLTSVNCPGAQVGADGKSRTVTYKKIYKLDGKSFYAGIDAAVLRAVVAYPFPRPGGTDTFKLDGHVELFFTTEPMKLRPEDAENTLYVHGDNDPDLPRMISGLQPAEQNVNGVFHISLGEHTLNFPDPCPDEQTAVLEVQDFNIQKRACAKTILQVMNDQPFLTVTWEHKQTAVEGMDGKVIGWKDVDAKRTEAYCGIPALNRNGAVDGNLAADKNVVGLLDSGTLNLTLNAAVCFRIKNEAGKTVDLVPAYMADDKSHNGLNNFQAMTSEANRMGSAYPLMLFRGGNSLVFSDTVFDKKEPVAFDVVPKAVCCLDPRWNWAPEHWIQCADITPNYWLEQCNNLFLKQGDFGADTYARDRDIFMSTSDTAYMQSVYELAFLPRITDLVDSGSSDIWGNVNQPNDQEWDTFPTVADFLTDKFPNRHLMWRTYCPFDRIWNGQTIAADDFERVGMVSNGGGYKVNPYSPDTNVVMAAFANTPICWWAACVNPYKDTGIAVNERLDAQSFNKKYCFNEISGTKSENKFKWVDLKRVAQNFVVKMHDNANPDNWEWQDGFDWLDWSGSLGHPNNPEEYRDYFGTPSSMSTGLDGLNYDQLDSDTCDLYDVDRKFLYGYWRECFAAKQQLFLVFVRAEPMMMGGGAVGVTPPQLGARAVALVWRDPTKSPDDQTPHRTRVLFYRQFD